jgi:hypothetical protein
MASGSLVLSLRLAAGQPGQRVVLARALGDADGLREGDVGTVLWTDDEIHLEMDAGALVSVVDPDALRRLDMPALYLPGAA